jgi:hypothetical protein
VPRSLAARYCRVVGSVVPDLGILLPVLLVCGVVYLVSPIAFG